MNLRLSALRPNAEQKVSAKNNQRARQQNENKVLTELRSAPQAEGPNSHHHLHLFLLYRTGDTHQVNIKHLVGAIFVKRPRVWLVQLIKVGDWLPAQVWVAADRIGRLHICSVLSILDPSAEL